MKTLLFVDDEENVLQGIRRLFLSEGEDYRILLASSGREALDLLKEHVVDVIISDMRMPGMSGAEVLEVVAKEYPTVARIILSGQAELSEVLQTVGPTHQYLAKPCDLEALRSRISRALLAVRPGISPRAAALATSMRSLPSPSASIQKIMLALEVDDASAADVGALVAEDPAFSARLLQIVNSAYFGVPRAITCPVTACTTLGLDNVRALATSEGVFSQLSALSIHQSLIESVRNHCATVGVLARRLATESGRSREIAASAFSAGLLHDCGKLILASIFPVPYQLVLRTESDASISLREQFAFGTTHADVGASLLAVWNLPNVLIEAVAYHHSETAPVGPAREVVCWVVAANHFAGMSNDLQDRDSAAPVWCREFLSEIGIDFDKLGEFLLAERTGRAA